MAQSLQFVIFTFSLMSALLLASIVDSRPLLSSQSRMSRPIRRNQFSGINMTSKAGDDNFVQNFDERNPNGLSTSQHLQAAHSWLAGEGRRDLIGLDVTQPSPSQTPGPAQDQADLVQGAAIGSSDSIPTDSISVSDLAISLGLSSSGWNWEFPAPFAPATPGMGLQSNLLLSQAPDTTPDAPEYDLSQDLAPAVISRVVSKPPSMTPQELERLELERLNEEELNDGNQAYFNDSEIFSRSLSEEDDDDKEGSNKDEKAPSIPNSALPTSESGKYVSNWLSSALNLYGRRVLVGADNLNFVDSPTKANEVEGPDGGNGSVLSVFYPNNSYSPSHSDPVGGVSFYAQPFSVSPESDAVDPSSGSSTDSYSTTKRDSSSSNPRVLIPALTSLPEGASNLYASTANTSTGFSASRPSLLLSYSVYFPQDFDFVKGGKLPGLYSSTGPVNSSGPVDANSDSCSGGASEEAGQSCWSVRMMWRAEGEGEAYLYLPIGRSGQYDPCGTSESGSDGKPRENWICNNDYGVSLGRGKFSFKKGAWTDLSLFVQLNSAPTVANGLLSVWSNGNQVIQESNMLFRTGSKVVTKTGKGGGSGENSKRTVQLPFDAAAQLGDQEAGQWVDKIFFSSFFGGATSDYASTSDTYSYFKDVSLHAGTSVSDLPGLDLTHSSGRGETSSGSTLTNTRTTSLSLVCLSILICSLL